MKYLRFAPIVLFPAVAAAAAWFGARGGPDSSLYDAGLGSISSSRDVAELSGGSRFLLLASREGAEEGLLFGTTLTIEVREESSVGPGVPDRVGDIDPIFELYGPRIDDLPPELREFTSIAGYSDVEERGLLLVATNWQAASDAASLQDPQAGLPAPQGTIDATAAVFVFVLQGPVDSGAGSYSADLFSSDRQGRMMLREDQTVDDFRRTYDERERSELRVDGVGDAARGERQVIAVLDYDAARDRYRSDRVLYWQIEDRITFARGRYAVMLSRTAYSSSQTPPDDLDLAGLARMLYERLAGAPE